MSYGGVFALTPPRQRECYKESPRADWWNGGLQLLNTVSNLGSMWPRFFVLRGVDTLSVATCQGGTFTNSSAPVSCVQDKTVCTSGGGACVVERDGYYLITTVCIIVGGLLLALVIAPRVTRLQGLPEANWRT